MAHEKVFIDWITASQFHPKGGLPIVCTGVRAQFDALGNCRFERTVPQRFSGSYGSTVSVLCDGFRVWLSGNVGRFDRPDNLFNLGWQDTIVSANRVLAMLGLPPFTAAAGTSDSDEGSSRPLDGRALEKPGCFVSRLDVTVNYATGSDGQARAVIRWLSGRSVARMKRGMSGDESVWFANTRHMLKAYRKGAEMKHHGGDPFMAQWAEDQGIVRVEVELKKRLLHDLEMNRIEQISDEKLTQVFIDQTEVFRRVDMSDEPDILSAIPARHRMAAAAWLAGKDLMSMCSRSAAYRHAKVLREYGLDVLEPRNVAQFPMRVRVVDLQPVDMPDWYSLKVAA